MAARRSTHAPAKAGILPSYSSEAEMSTLGAMILSERAIEKVLADLRMEEFYVPAHQVIFGAIRSLHTSGTQVDLVTLKDQLIREGKLDEVGGIDYLVQIGETVPSAANAEYYAGIVRAKAVLRSLSKRANDILTDIQACEYSPDELVTRALSHIEPLARWSTKNDPWQRLTEVDISRSERGIKVGFPSIESSISCRGLPGGQVTIVQAGTGVGKTLFMTQMAWHVALEGGNVCYAIFADLTPAQWKRRLFKLLTGYSTAPTNLEQEVSWREAEAVLSDPFGDGTNILIYRGDSEDGAGHVETFCRQLLLKHAETPFDMVVVDYLQEIETDKQFIQTNDKVAYVSAQLMKTAAKLGDTCAMVVGSQLTEDLSSGRTRARYGTEITNKSGLALEVKKKDQENEATVVIRKSRFGPKFTIPGFGFDPRTLKFIDPQDWVAKPSGV